MADRDDIKKAKEKIDNILKLGQNIQIASPHLNGMKANLDWYEEACNAITEKENDIILPITSSLQDIQKMDYSAINAPLCSGIEASFMSASAAETRKTILSSSDEYHYLIQEYNNIYKIEDLFSEIIRILALIEPKIRNHFEDIKLSYAQWKAGLRSNSDLAKDTRTFQEQFEGTLNKLRVPKVNWEEVSIPKISWNKMVDKISKKGSSNKRAFMQQQRISEAIWDELTPVMKKTNEVNKKTMDSLFKRYVEHVYAVLNLIDENIINQ